MEKERSHATDRILNLTLEIVYLLTGENYIAFKLSDGLVASNVMKPQSPVPELPSHSLRRNKKVQEVTSEIIKLLTGEVPMRCQDTTDCFSMEEWEYLEGHTDLYKNTTMGNQLSFISAEGNQTTWRKCAQTLGEHANFMQEVSMAGHRTSGLQDGSRNRNTPERCPRPLYSWDSTQEHQEIPQEHQEIPREHQEIPQEHQEIPQEDQGEGLIIVKAEGDEEPHVSGEESCKEEEIPPEISTDPEDTRDTQKDIKPEEEEEEHARIKEEDVLPENNRDPRDTRSHVKPEEGTRVRVEEEEIPIEVGRGRLSNSNTPERCPSPLDSQDSTEEDDGQDYQDTSLVTIVKVEVKEEAYESHVSGDEQCKEEVPPEISRDGRYIRTSRQQRPSPASLDGDPDDDITSDSSEENPISSTLQECHSSDLSSDPSQTKKLYSCSECGKCFLRRSRLLRHQTIHTGEKPFSCSQCGKCFTQKGGLARHEITHVEKKPYACSECGKRYSQKTYLAVHQRTHAPEKPFSCSKCAERFADKDTLLAHQDTHKGQKPFACSECGKWFSYKSLLVRHERIHTGERPYSCSVCGKGFIDKQGLVTHQSTHSTDRPYSCPQCGKSFTNKSNLAGHRRIHTGYQPYSCSECGKRFSKKYTLIKHQKLHK